MILNEMIHLQIRLWEEILVRNETISDVWSALDRVLTSCFANILCFKCFQASTVPKILARVPSKNLWFSAWAPLNKLKSGSYVNEWTDFAWQNPVDGRQHFTDKEIVVHSCVSLQFCTTRPLGLWSESDMSTNIWCLFFGLVWSDFEHGRCGCLILKGGRFFAKRYQVWGSNFHHTSTTSELEQSLLDCSMCWIIRCGLCTSTCVILKEETRVLSAP